MRTLYQTENSSIEEETYMPKKKGKQRSVSCSSSDDSDDSGPNKLDLLRKLDDMKKAVESYKYCVMHT